MSKSKKPKRRRKKTSLAFKEHSKRSAYLNPLASSINNIVGSNSNRQKPGDFYSMLLKRFRRQPSNNRFLLLHSLKSMDVHPKYTLSRFQGLQKIIVKTGSKSITVTLNIKGHPREFFKTNCYRYQLLLITWNRNNEETNFVKVTTEWIYPSKVPNPKNLPDYEFSFDRKPDIIHWLLCLKLQMGFNSKANSVKTQGMGFVDVGTFDEDDAVLLSKYLADEEKKNPPSRNDDEDDGIEMMKPKKKR